MNATDKFQVKQALGNGGLFSYFMPVSQRYAVRDMLKGEEGAALFEKMLALKKTIETMPTTYQTDGQGDAAVVHLHYFRGGVDAWVTEKDRGDGSGEQGQFQAFGKVDLGYGAELGYISIAELIENDVELDLYWTPKTLGELK